ncbi:MAG: hypothetical protein Ct9H300mP17_15960 [Candidatus Nitrosopelagicus sp.]|nr:MAG: hypothetical protein Ct9H300mP17_15960 [Candidatus Nitrosopelagicus sp.]
MAAQTPKGNMPVVVLKDDASQVKGEKKPKKTILQLPKLLPKLFILV